jgi:type IV pilus assembly protein PilF
MNPDHRDAHYLMGFIYMGRRKYTTSIRHFREVLRIDPDYHPARNNLGAVYLSMERWRDAVEQFEVLLEQPLYTTPELAHNNVGWAYYQLRRYEKAVHHLKMAIFLKPKFCLGYNNLGLVRRAMGQRSSASKNFRKALEYCPNNYAEPHFNLGKLLQEQGERSARLHFRRCVELQPHSNLGERCRQYIR